MRRRFRAFGDHAETGEVAESLQWWTRWDGGGAASSWSTDTRFPNHYSREAPAVIAYRDKNSPHSQLLCVHRGS